MNQTKIQQLKFKIIELESSTEVYTTINLNRLKKKKSVNLKIGQKRLCNQDKVKKEWIKMDKSSEKYGPTLHVSTYT